MIQQFNNEAAHAAATKSAIESAVVLIESSNKVVADGVNVITTCPKVGDILVLDENNKKRYIELESYQAATFPSAWTIVGVVGFRQGNKVIVVNKANAAQKWSAVNRWKFSGAAISDNTSHTGTLKIGNDEFSFTWQTASAAAFAAALNTFVATNTPAGHTYHAYYDEDAEAVFLIHDTHTTHLGVTLTGVTVDQWIGRELNATFSIIRNNFVSAYYGGMNRARFYEYYKNSGSTPTSQVAVTSDTIVNKTAFETSEYCDLLRAKWADYDAYIDAQCIRFPAQRGILAPEYRDGKANTYALVGKTYKDADGEDQPLYSAAEYCAKVEYNAKGLKKGSWFLPSLYQMFKVWANITYGLSGVTRANADPLNRGLNKIGGSAISCTSLSWSSCRYNASGAWCYNYYGYAYGRDFYGGYTAVPCVLLDLSESED